MGGGAYAEEPKGTSIHYGQAPYAGGRTNTLYQHAMTWWKLGLFYMYVNDLHMELGMAIEFIFIWCLKTWKFFNRLFRKCRYGISLGAWISTFKGSGIVLYENPALACFGIFNIYLK